MNKILDDKEIICYMTPGANCDKQWKFASTNSMIWPTLHWFHTLLGHTGSCHMHTTLQAWYHHPHLSIHVEHFACDKCQHAKPSGHSHSLLSDQDIAGAPWEEVADDLIGPWPVSTLHAIMESFALTCIDSTTNLIKISCIFKKSNIHIATYFEHTWFYSWPMQVIHDNGGEFIGFFQQMSQL